MGPFTILTLTFNRGLLRPFIGRHRTQLVTSRTFGTLTRIVRTISGGNVFGGVIFYSVFAIGTILDGLYTVRGYIGVGTYADGKRRTSDNRGEVSTTRLVQGSRTFMALFVNGTFGDTLYLVNYTRGTLYNFLYKVFLVGGLSRCTRYGDELHDYTTFKGGVRAGVLVLTCFGRFVRR